MADSRDGNAEALVEERIQQLLAKYPPSEVSELEFLGAQFDAGLAFIDFPEGNGGLGLAKSLQALVNDRLGAAGAPWARPRNAMGYGMGAPTVMNLGNEAQRRRYLRPIFTCEEIWCQLFSEPGAGSDLAGLATRAVRDGDDWIINGQKVWTTLAHVSQQAMLVVRTDPETAKHRGLTYFVLDMNSPGVDVRALRQLTGDAEFNEVYLTDVRVPDANRLGEVGDGWRGSLVTLMNERNSIGGQLTPRWSGPIGTAREVWNGLPEDERSAVRRDRLAQLFSEAELLRLTRERVMAETAAGGSAGPGGSIGKLAGSELNQRIYRFCVELLGAEGMLYESYEMHRPSIAVEPRVPPLRGFLRSVAQTIEGGTSEIQRNIIAERVLGFPGDIRVDKDVPWTKVPRS